MILHRDVVRSRRHIVASLRNPWRCLISLVSSGVVASRAGRPFEVACWACGFRAFTDWPHNGARESIDDNFIYIYIPIYACIHSFVHIYMHIFFIYTYICMTPFRFVAGMAKLARARYPPSKAQEAAEVPALEMASG